MCHDICLDDPFTLFVLVLILALGLLIGWALGTVYVHAPVVNYFRDYYRRWADERCAAHTRFVQDLLENHGAAAASHRCAVRGDGQRSGGHAVSLITPLGVNDLPSLFRTLEKGKEERAYKKLP